MCMGAYGEQQITEALVSELQHSIWIEYQEGINRNKYIP